MNDVSQSSSSSSIIESQKYQNNMKKSLSFKKIRNACFALALILIVGGTGWWLGNHNIRSPKDLFSKNNNSVVSVSQNINRTQTGNKSVDMNLFWQVWDKLEKEYLFKDRMDYQKMVYGAIKGMASSVGDPYTSFYPPKENQTSKENLNGSFEGVGIQMGYKKDQIMVIAPISGMPAERAGVKAGDFIIKIVDEKEGVDVDAYGLNIMEAVKLIRGEGGTPVKLTLLHEGASETYEVEIIRETIIVPSVEVEIGKIIDNSFVTDEKAMATSSAKLVAHLQLSRFGELTDDQWDQAIDKILAKEDKLAGVVLDVRNNPGGLVDASVNLAAEFLPLGKVVVKQESTVAPNQDFQVKRLGRLLNMPVSVLINKGSASASEILAGALRDYERAKLVGETSFGKGTIQQAQDLDANGAGVHITIARWLTPNGDWIHDKGLVPDYEVAFDPENPTVDTQLIKAVEILGE